MEIRQYLLLLRKWAWLFLVLAEIGAVAAYLITVRQPMVFETLAKVMIMGAVDDRTTTYYYSSYYDDIQRAKNYAQLIVTKPVLETLSDRLGFDISTGQIDVRQVQDSQILEITVKDSDAAQSALIANSLIDVFIEYNDSLQSTRFASSEESLKTQIDQVESQINSLQQEMSQFSELTVQTQQQQVEKQIADLEVQVKSIEDEIELLIPTLTPYPAAIAVSTQSAPVLETPTPTPTLTISQLGVIKQTTDTINEKQDDIENLRKTLELYRQVYLNLLVFGQSEQASSTNANQGQNQSTLALYQQIYSNLLNSYENIRLARLRSTPNVVKIEEAVVPVKPIQPQPIRAAALGALVGLILAGGIAFMVEYLDDTLKTPEDINRVLNLPVIGFIGQMDRGGRKKKDRENKDVYVVRNPRSPIAEAFRTLRTNLEFASIDKPLKTLLITSADPSEGKTTIAVNLASVIAQGDNKVTIIDADLRRPSIHKFLNITNHSGLSDVFRDPSILPNHTCTMGRTPI